MEFKLFHCHYHGIKIRQSNVSTNDDKKIETLITIYLHILFYHLRNNNNNI